MPMRNASSPAARPPRLRQWSMRAAPPAIALLIGLANLPVPFGPAPGRCAGPGHSCADRPGDADPGPGDADPAPGRDAPSDRAPGHHTDGDARPPLPPGPAAAPSTPTRPATTGAPTPAPATAPRAGGVPTELALGLLGASAAVRAGGLALL